MKLQSTENAVRLTINDDPDRVIAFNPNDAGFAERFFAMLDKVEAEEARVNAVLAEYAGDDTVDSYGIPLPLRKAASLTAELCRFMRGQIDEVFGEGTSQTAFGDVNVPEMFSEFFRGVTPYIREARSAALSKYIGEAKT